MKRNFHIIAVSALLLHAAGSYGQTPAPMPQWYLDTGLPATDADEDGIPDAWERRTFGDPAAADSGLDRDGDVLTDLEEFEFGSDPRTRSTMGDGWSDKEKRDAGLDAASRVTPSVSSSQWLDWLGWTAQDWQTLTATNAEGFTAYYADFVYNTAPYSEENGAADFWVVTRADRPVWLTVGDALTTNSFPVRAGTGRVRIRAAYGGPVSLTLDPLPGALEELPGATNGLWLCDLSVEPVHANTVLFSDGETPPPVPGDPDSVNGLLLLGPPPAAAVHPLASLPPGVTLQPLRMTDGSAFLGYDGWYCLCNSVPPCAWPNYEMIGCDAVSTAMNGLEGGTPLMSKEDAWDIYWERFPCVQCTVTQTVANARYPFIYGKVIFSFRPCEAHGGVSGAEQSVPRHEPDYGDHSLCGGIGCQCDGGPFWVVGFGHGLVSTCFQTRHPEEPSEDKLYHHCLGVVWDGQPVNLADLCVSHGFDLASLVVWEVNGKRLESSALTLGAEPPDLEPSIFRVKMLLASDTGILWDRLILVVNNSNTKTAFDAWYNRFSVETNWLAELPAAYRALAAPTTNWLGVVSRDPEPITTNLWANKVDRPGKFMHHTAAWQMRSNATLHGHGHQACYDTADDIILTGVSAGTADFGGNPTLWDHEIHVTEDVDPFIRALQLDGNPCQRRLTSLTHALIYDGGYMIKYRECRPSIPNGKGLLAPNQLPQP